MLCQLCKSIFDAWVDCTVRVAGKELFGKAWKKRGPHHVSTEDLKISASLNCYICHILLTQWRREVQESHKENPFFYYVNYSLNRDTKKYEGFVKLGQRGSGLFVDFGLEAMSEAGKI